MSGLPEPKKGEGKEEEEEKEGKQQEARMTLENTGITIEYAPATFKSFVWQHFGYPAEMINGSRVIDKTRTVCKHCMKIMSYIAVISFQFVEEEVY